MKDQIIVSENIDSSETFLWVVMILVLAEVLPVVCWFVFSCFREWKERKANDRRRQYEMAAGVQNFDLSRA